jgi:hypothetical protein
MPGAEAYARIEAVWAINPAHRLPILAMAPEPGQPGLPATDVVLKPLDPGALHDAIARLLGGDKVADVGRA